MGARPYKPRRAKGTVAVSHKNAKIKDKYTGEVRTYTYYQASMLVSGTDPETGQPFRKRITASAPRQKDAIDNLYKKVIWQGQSYEVKPVKPKSTSGTVSAMLDDFLVSRENDPEVRDEVVRKYRSYVEKHIRPELGDTKLEELTGMRLKDFFITLRKKKKQVKVDGVWQETDELYFSSTSSLLNIYKTLNAGLNLAIANKRLTHNPLKAVKAPKAQKRSDNVAQLAHIALSLMTRLKEQNHPDYCRFLLPYLGLRSGERLGIQLDDIKNLGSKEARIVIHSQLEYKVGSGWWINPETKSGKERSIPVPEPFLSVLRDYVKKRKGWEKTPEWKPAPEFANLLFLKPDGKLIDKKQDTKDWHKIFETTKGYENAYWQQHVNRHITATLLANQENPVPIAIVRELLGHYADAMSYYYATINNTTLKKNMVEYGEMSFAPLFNNPEKILPK